jgi:chromosome segregation ATPase
MPELQDLLEERDQLVDERDRARARVAELEREAGDRARATDAARIAAAEAEARVATAERGTARVTAELTAARQRIRELEQQAGAVDALGRAAIDRHTELERTVEETQSRLQALEDQLARIRLHASARRHAGTPDPELERLSS